jgi:hypothetical protein
LGSVAGAPRAPAWSAGGARALGSAISAACYTKTWNVKVTSVNTDEFG